MHDRQTTPGSDLSRLADCFVDAAQDRARKAACLALLQRPQRLLDVGCGRGALLDLQRQAGGLGLGLDASPAAMAELRARGLEVRCGDAAELLAQLAAQGESFDGAAMLHVVEHLQPAAALQALALIQAVLRPGGRLVVATPNVRNHIVWSQVFWLDPTHLRPYPRPLLERMGESAGLRVVASFDDPASRPRRGALARALAAARSLLSGVDRSGPMDSIVVFARE